MYVRMSMCVCVCVCVCVQVGEDFLVVRFWVKHSVENFFKKYQVILSLMGREGEGTEIATMLSTNNSLKTSTYIES